MVRSKIIDSEKISRVRFDLIKKKIDPKNMISTSIYNSVFKSAQKRLTPTKKYIQLFQLMVIQLRNQVAYRLNFNWTVVSKVEKEKEEKKKLEKKERRLFKHRMLDPNYSEMVEMAAYACPEYLTEPDSDDDSEAADIARSAVYQGVSRYKMRVKIRSSYQRDLTREGIEPNPGPRNYPKMKKNNVKRKRRNRKEAPRGPTKRREETNDFPLIRTRIQPNHIIQEFQYPLLSTPFNNPGGQIVSEIFYSNDAYDWLTSILTPEMQFLNRQFQLYGKGKVLTMEITFGFTNLEQVELDLSLFSSPESLTTIASSKTAIQSAMPTGIYRGGAIMSEQYSKGSKIIFSDSINIGNVVGNKFLWRASEDYSFSQSSGCPKNTYFGWFASTPLSTINTGLTRRVSIKANILFYDMLTLSANVFKKLDFIPNRSNRDLRVTYTDPSK